MKEIVELLIIWLVTAVSFVIISKIPLLGVEIDSFNKALVSAGVFGILNAIIRAIFYVPNKLTFQLFSGLSFILNIIAFGLAAWLIVGFRLRWGIWSAVLGAIALSLVNSLLFSLLKIRV